MQIYLNPHFKYLLGLLVMMVLVMSSAISVAYSVHVSRQQVGELSRLLRMQDELQMEWEKLLVEINMLSAYNRVEINARNRLGMRAPDEAQVRIIRLAE